MSLNKEKKLWLLLAIAFLVIFCPKQASAATKYQVKFTNNAGTSTSAAYKKLYITADKGTTVTLPKLPKVSGYASLGWSVKKNQTKADYKQGAKVKVTKNITYYAVYKKTQTVKFYMAGGAVNTDYKELWKTVYKGNAITLPSIPSRSGYYNKGWKVRINGKVVVYQPGDKITVTADMIFYSWQVEGPTVYFYNADGKVIKTVTVEKGTEYTLPSMPNVMKNGTTIYTFMGWNTLKNQISDHTTRANIKYEAGDRITVNGNLRLYPVLFKRSAVGSVRIGTLVSATKSALADYDKLIIVGDSRTVRMKQVLNVSTLTTNFDAGKKIDTVAKYGQGLSWFRSTGYPELLNKIQNLRENGNTGKIAVVFNLGVNDLTNINNYINEMNKISAELTEQGCELFYMSVNPFNKAQMQWAKNKGYASVAAKSERSLKVFNRRLKAGLNSDYTYIDTYSYLMTYGYETDKGSNAERILNTGIDDGLHYTENTYKWIYLRMLEGIVQKN